MPLPPLQGAGQIFARRTKGRISLPFRCRQRSKALRRPRGHVWPLAAEVEGLERAACRLPAAMPRRSASRGRRSDSRRRRSRSPKKSKAQEAPEIGRARIVDGALLNTGAWPALSKRGS